MGEISGQTFKLAVEALQFKKSVEWRCATNGATNQRHRDEAWTRFHALEDAILEIQNAVGERVPDGTGSCGDSSVRDIPTD